MSKIRVNTTSLRATQNEVSSCLTSLERSLQAVQLANTGLQLMWSGDAAREFHNTMTKDLNRAFALVKNLNKLPQNEGQAKTEYDNCERQVSQMIAAIKI